MEELPIAYAQHPLTKKEKRELMAKGFKVLDLRFKPKEIGKDDKVITKPKPKAS